MKQFLLAASVLTATVGFLAPRPADAGPLCTTSTTSCTLTLDTGNAGSGFGTGNFGTVDLELSATNTVTVTVDLASGFFIIKTGFPGSFGFSDSLAGTISVDTFSSSAYSGFTSHANSDLHFDGFGYFDDAAATTGPSAGDAARQNVVSFKVHGTGLNDVNQLLNSANPTGGDANAFFVVDAINTNAGPSPGAGNTGLLAVTGSPGCPPGQVLGPNGCQPTNPVPEPASMLILGSGLIALGAVVRRRRAKFQA
jgi:hypothetical protein